MYHGGGDSTKLLRNELRNSKRAPEYLSHFYWSSKRFFPFSFFIHVWSAARGMRWFPIQNEGLWVRLAGANCQNTFCQSQCPTNEPKGTCTVMCIVDEKWDKKENFCFSYYTVHSCVQMAAADPISRGLHLHGWTPRQPIIHPTVLYYYPLPLLLYYPANSKCEKVAVALMHVLHTVVVGLETKRNCNFTFPIKTHIGA